MSYPQQQSRGYERQLIRMILSTMVVLAGCNHTQKLEFSCGISTKNEETVVQEVVSEDDRKAQAEFQDAETRRP